MDPKQQRAQIPRCRKFGRAQKWGEARLENRLDLADLVATSVLTFVAAEMEMDSQANKEGIFTYYRTPRPRGHSSALSVSWRQDPGLSLSTPDICFSHS